MIKVIYQTEDGLQFEDKYAAEAHNNLAKLRCEIEDADIAASVYGVVTLDDLLELIDALSYTSLNTLREHIEDKMCD